MCLHCEKMLVKSRERCVYIGRKGWLKTESDVFTLGEKVG